jgi:AbrB family looped-hinge helix DNA binding protein
MERRERILDVTAVTGRYQITLTKPVRELLKVEIGDRVVFIERDGEIIIRKA